MANEPRFEVFPEAHHNVNHLTEEIVTVPTGEYGWRFRAANGQITAIGGEGFSRIEDAERAVTQFLDTTLEIATGHAEWPAAPILRVDE